MWWIRVLGGGGGFGFCGMEVFLGKVHRRVCNRQAFVTTLQNNQKGCGTNFFIIMYGDEW